MQLVNWNRDLLMNPVSVVDCWFPVSLSEPAKSTIVIVKFWTLMFWSQSSTNYLSKYLLYLRGYEIWRSLNEILHAHTAFVFILFIRSAGNFQSYWLILLDSLKLNNLSIEFLRFWEVFTLLRVNLWFFHYKFEGNWL